MNKPTLLLALLLATGVSQAQQTDTFDYFAANRTMVRNGVQAVLMCNGLFTSGRTLEQVFRQELAYLTDPVGTPDGGEYIIEEKLKAVAIGGPGRARSAARAAVVNMSWLSPHTTWSSCDAVWIMASRVLTRGT